MSKEEYVIRLIFFFNLHFDRPELKLAFSFFDIDKDGYIGIEDLKALYSANNVDSLMQLDSKEVSQIFNSNKNGITFPLFQSILRHSHSLDISSDVALKLRFAFRSIDQFNFISDIWRNSLIGSLEGAETRPKEKSSRIDWNMVKSLFSGAVAGAVSRTVTSPLERLKVIKQIQMGDKYKGVIAPLIQMYKEEGIRSYWKGNGTNVARIAPYSAIQFFTFDVYKEMLSDNRENPGTLNVLTAGGLAGMTSTIFCYPLDLVRSILTVQTSNAEYKGMNDALVKIYRTQGFFGLYKGLGTTLMV
jgi:Ca2+-binding EF-hand superfamily protein